jgi:hypothetical protein
MPHSSKNSHRQAKGGFLNLMKEFYKPNGQKNSVVKKEGTL